MPLEDLQRDFAAALASHANVPALRPWLDTTDPRTDERIALYRGNLVGAWQKALSNTYPVLRAIVGAEFFDAMARAYGLAHPGSSGDLNRFGGEMSAFVGAFEPARALPYLPDVAALEWQVHRAHFAADAEPLPRQRLAALLPHDLLATRFDLHPACAWIASTHPLATIWRAHQPEPLCALPNLPAAGEIALVVRPRWKVEVEVASSAEIAALALLREGRPLQDAIEVALHVAPSFDLPRTLVRWLDLGVITRMHTPPDA